MIITELTKGVCPYKAQRNEPPYFVTCVKDGKRVYDYFRLPYAMYQRYNLYKKFEA